MPDIVSRNSVQSKDLSARLREVLIDLNSARPGLPVAADDIRTNPRYHGSSQKEPGGAKAASAGRGRNWKVQAPGTSTEAGEEGLNFTRVEP